LNIIKDGNAHFIQFIDIQEQGAINSLILTYGGRPKISARPPWEGGITWKKDKTTCHLLLHHARGTVPVSGGPAKTTCMTNPTVCSSV